MICQELLIEIKGPYSFLKTQIPSFFDISLIDRKGIYLWTVPYMDSELVYYVGQTGRSFRTRMIEHIKGYISGEYGINDPEELQKGKRVRLWQGLCRGGKIIDFLTRHDKLFPKIMELFNLFRLYLIPLPLDCESRLRKRIEGTIAEILYNYKGVVGEFQEPDIKYQKPKINRGTIRIELRHNSKILGLPDELIIED